MADENTATAGGRCPVCPPEAAPAESAGAPASPVTASEAPALPAAAGEAPPEGARGGYGVWRTAPATSLFAADAGMVEGARSAVRALARRIAGVEGSKAPVPACAGVAFQAVSPYGAQWVMNCDLTPGTLYLVTYDGIQPSYTVDAYSPACGMCVPEEQCHG